MKHAIGSTLIAAACLAAALVARAGDAAVQPGGTLPDTMIGTWGWDGDSCRRDDDGRVTVTAKSVTFFAASYDLRSIVEEGDGTIRATAIVHTLKPASS